MMSLRKLITPTLATCMQRTIQYHGMVWRVRGTVVRDMDDSCWVLGMDLICLSSRQAYAFMIE